MREASPAAGCSSRETATAVVFNARRTNVPPLRRVRMCVSPGDGRCPHRVECPNSPSTCAGVLTVRRRFNPAGSAANRGPELSRPLAPPHPGLPEPLKPRLVAVQFRHGDLTRQDRPCSVNPMMGAMRPGVCALWHTTRTRGCDPHGPAAPRRVFAVGRASLCEVRRSTVSLPLAADQIESRHARCGPRAFDESSGLRSSRPQGRGGSSPLFRCVSEGAALRARSGDDGKSLTEALRWLTPRSRWLYSAC